MKIPTPKTVPLVTLFVPPDRRGAEWSGKWHLNTGNDYVRSIGGPWESEEAAIRAVLATGRYVLQTDAQTTQFVKTP